jgi:hypothetical protein
MSRHHAPYPPEFRQPIELIRAGRSRLKAREFEISPNSITKRPYSDTTGSSGAPAELTRS